MVKQILAATTALCMLAACAQQGSGGYGSGSGGGISKSDIGTVVGAGLGGWAGHNVGGGSGQVIATIGGTLLGAALGNQLGASLDRADMAYYNQTSQQAMETAQPGQSLPWRNPQSGNYGNITPSNYYETANGQYCREYNQTITVGGRTERGYGTACRQPDGTWQMVQ